MGLSKTNKTTLIVFLYTLIVKVLANYSMVFDNATFIISPMFFMTFTWMCIEEYKPVEGSSLRIISTILIGDLILTLPIRIFHFNETIGSLSQEIMCIVGIGLAWFLSKYRKVWLLLLLLLIFVIVASTFGES